MISRALIQIYGAVCDGYCEYSVQIQIEVLTRYQRERHYGCYRGNIQCHWSAHYCIHVDFADAFSNQDTRRGPLTEDLVPFGSQMVVTEQNKREYVDLIVKYCAVKRVDKQMEALMEGFFDLISKEDFEAMRFDVRELATLFIIDKRKVRILHFRIRIVQLMFPFLQRWM